MKYKFDFFKKFDFVKDMIKKYNLIEYYNDFNIFDENFMPDKNDILKFIKNGDILSLKNCFNYDYRIDDYDLFFISLLTKNIELINIIYNFIDDKQHLKCIYEKIKCVLDNDVKNIYNDLIYF